MYMYMLVQSACSSFWQITLKYCKQCDTQCDAPLQHVHIQFHKWNNRFLFCVFVEGLFTQISFSTPLSHFLPLIERSIAVWNNQICIHSHTYARARASSTFVRKVWTQHKHKQRPFSCDRLNSVFFNSLSIFRSSILGNILLSNYIFLSHNWLLTQTVRFQMWHKLNIVAKFFLKMNS